MFSLLLSWALHPSVLCSCQQWGYPRLGYRGRSYLELCRRVPLRLFRWLKIGNGPKSLFRQEVNSPRTLGNRWEGVGVDGQSPRGAVGSVGLLPARLGRMLEYGLWKVSKAAVEDADLHSHL